MLLCFNKRSVNNNTHKAKMEKEKREPTKLKTQNEKPIKEHI